MASTTTPSIREREQERARCFFCERKRDDGGGESAALSFESKWSRCRFLKEDDDQGKSERLFFSHSRFFSLRLARTSMLVAAAPRRTTPPTKRLQVFSSIALSLTPSVACASLGGERNTKKKSFLLEKRNKKTCFSKSKPPSIAAKATPFSAAVSSAR